MIVYTDTPDFASSLLPDGCGWLPVSRIYEPLASLAAEVFGSGPLFHARVAANHRFTHFLVTDHSPRSQYDILVEACRADNDLPDGLLCLAGTGDGFHGLRGRSWASPPGNVYLSVLFRPRREIAHFGPGFVILPNLGVIGALDGVAGLAGRASARWVNDVVLDEAKVGGVLTYTQSQGLEVTAVVLGIGINVLTTPRVPPTRFVPRVISLADCLPAADPALPGRVLERLLTVLDRDYAQLLAGGYPALLQRYRERSAVLGARVAVYADEPGEAPLLAEGVVETIGENLELTLAGQSRPVTRGRLVMVPPTSAQSSERGSSCLLTTS